MTSGPPAVAVCVNYMHRSAMNNSEQCRIITGYIMQQNGVDSSPATIVRLKGGGGGGTPVRGYSTERFNYQLFVYIMYADFTIRTFFLYSIIIMYKSALIDEKTTSYCQKRIHVFRRPRVIFYIFIPSYSSNEYRLLTKDVSYLVFI